MKQSVQDDSSLLDVNAMSITPEAFFGSIKVGDSLSTFMVDFSVTEVGRSDNGTECSHSMEHKLLACGKLICTLSEMEIREHILNT